MLKRAIIATSIAEHHFLPVAARSHAHATGDAHIKRREDFIRVIEDLLRDQ